MQLSGWPRIKPLKLNRCRVGACADLGYAPSKVAASSDPTIELYESGRVRRMGRRLIRFCPCGGRGKMALFFPLKVGLFWPPAKKIPVELCSWRLSPGPQGRAFFCQHRNLQLFRAATTSAHPPTDFHLSVSRKISPEHIVETAGPRLEFPDLYISIRSVDGSRGWNSANQ